VLTQRPPLHALLQHSLARWQAALTPRHAPPPHIPSTHDWLQQSVYVLHAAPAEPHPWVAPLPPPPAAESGSYGCHPEPNESVLP
jgi:hypothetical protein